MHTAKMSFSETYFSDLNHMLQGEDFQSDMQVGTWLRKAFQGIMNSNEDPYLNMHKGSYAEGVSLI